MAESADPSRDSGAEISAGTLFGDTPVGIGWVVQVVGGLAFLVGAALLAVGTESVGVFIAYGVLAVVGAIAVAGGQRMRGAATEPQPDTPSANLAPRTLGGSRTTIALVVAILVLAGVAMVATAYLWGPLQDEPTVSAETPILTDEAAFRSAVDAAADATVKFTARSFETYDEQVDQATAAMTDSFAEEYRATTEEIKTEFVDSKTVVTAEVVAQSVRTASDEQVEVLLFLNQFTTKDGGDTAYTPYRILVTMLNTDQGWLVSDVETA